MLLEEKYKGFFIFAYDKFYINIGKNIIDREYKEINIFKNIINHIILFIFTLNSKKQVKRVKICN